MLTTTFSCIKNIVCVLSSLSRFFSSLLSIFSFSFLLISLQAAGINKKLAKTVGIAVDHRRTNKCEESLKMNVERLSDYKARLVVFPRRSGTKSTKAGDASKADVAAYKTNQLSAPLNAVPAAAAAVTFAAVTKEMTEFNGYAALRGARNDARMKGIREKKAKAPKEEEKAPKAAATTDE